MGIFWQWMICPLPLKKGMSEAHYVLVGRIATVVVVVLGFAWLPIMMKMDTLYNYLQGIQSLLAPAMVAVYAMGIFFKKITPKNRVCKGVPDGLTFIFHSELKQNFH